MGEGLSMAPAVPSLNFIFFAEGGRGYGSSGSVLEWRNVGSMLDCLDWGLIGRLGIALLLLL
jgi:hypothetical protein